MCCHRDAWHYHNLGLRVQIDAADVRRQHQAKIKESLRAEYKFLFISLIVENQRGY